MMARGIPLVGRGPDGKAKIVDVDENGALKVAQSGNIVKKERLLNAVSVAGNSSTGEVSLGNTGQEREIWLAIRIDGQPWTLAVGNNLSLNPEGGAYKRQAVYPEYVLHDKAYPSYYGYAMALLLGNTSHDSNLDKPQNMLEAKAMAIPLLGGAFFRIDNNSDHNVTVTVDKISVWR